MDGLERFWQVCPGLRDHLFAPLREGYLSLPLGSEGLRSAIFEHPEFVRLSEELRNLFSEFRKSETPRLKALDEGCHPKQVIHEFSESLLAHYQSRPLLDAYAVYQHLMDYWAETMQDDLYLISADGWKAEAVRILETDKKGRSKDKGWACDLVPKELVVNRYFFGERDALREMEGQLETLNAELSELEEEQGGEEGAFAEMDKVNAANVKAWLKALKADREDSDDRSEEAELLRQWLRLHEQAAVLKKEIKAAERDLDDKAYAHYARLDRAAIQTLVVDDKWMGRLETALQSETDRISQSLTQRVKELAERYQAPLPELTEQAGGLEAKVMAHLARMGVAP